MNEITTVCKTFVYKRYSLPEKFYNEIESLRMLSELTPNKVPNVISTTNNLCVMETVVGLNGNAVSDKNFVSTETIKIVLDIYKSYKPKCSTDNNSWKQKLIQIKEDLKNNEQTLRKFGSTKITKKLLSDLEILINYNNYKTITYVHGDLHLGNIILNDSGVCLIDFEHSMEAPIELELQNSIFWNDEMSLDVEICRSLIVKARIEYSAELEILLMSFYISKQLLLALKEQDFLKLNLLINKGLSVLNIE